MQSKRAPLTPTAAKESNLRKSSSIPTRGNPGLNSELYEMKVFSIHLCTCRSGIQLGPRAGELSEKIRRNTDAQIDGNKSRIFPDTEIR